MGFKTTREQEAFRERVRAFAEAEIKPYAFQWDQENRFPWEIVRKMAEQGWMGIPYPREYGGAGLDAICYAIAVEELSRVDGGCGVILCPHLSGDLAHLRLWHGGAEAEVSGPPGLGRKAGGLWSDGAQRRFGCRPHRDHGRPGRGPLSSER